MNAQHRPNAICRSDSQVAYFPLLVPSLFEEKGIHGWGTLTGITGKRRPTSAVPYYSHGQKENPSGKGQRTIKIKALLESISL